MQQIQQQRISSIHDFVELLGDCATLKNTNEVWYRGQANSNWDLLPSIFRDNYSPSRETSLCISFINAARGMRRNCPEDHAFFSWLVLMQHHGLHTRLLDWTKNPLAALFFAIVSDTALHCDSVVWKLDVGVLMHSLTSGECSAVRTISEPFDRCSPFLSFFQECWLPWDTSRMRIGIDIQRHYCAVNASHIDPRIVSQQGVFMIHGSSAPLNHSSFAIQFLTKIIVPKEKIVEMRRMLRALGITRRLLFPDLDNLATDLNTCPEYLH